MDGSTRAAGYRSTTTPGERSLRNLAGDGRKSERRESRFWEYGENSQNGWTDKADVCYEWVVFKPAVIGTAGVALVLAGCCGFRDTGLPPVENRCRDEIVILSAPPPRTYREVGTVTTPGGNADSAYDNYRRMQAGAAHLGGDAVILTDWRPEPSTDFWERPHVGVAIAYTVSQL
ncbi:MAG TPA: hypothetical protein VGD78_20690 [Chthoniobacterales bacterium]